MADTTSRAGGRYAKPEIIDYVNRVHAPHDPGLAQAFTVPDGVPAIQVGQSDGKLIALVLRLAQASKVVEVGTLIGYSAIYIARAIGPRGRVWSIEYEARHAELARKNLAAAGVAD